MKVHLEGQMEANLDERIKGTNAVSQFAYFCTYTYYFECISAFTLVSMAKCSVLLVPGWCTQNGQKVECGTLDTSHP